VGRGRGVIDRGNRRVRDLPDAQGAASGLGGGGFSRGAARRTQRGISYLAE